MFSDKIVDEDNYRYLANPKLLEDIKKAENGEYF